MHGRGSAHDLFSGSGFIHKEYIMSSLYKDRKNQSNLMQFWPPIPSSVQHVSTFRCFYLNLQTL